MTVSVGLLLDDWNESTHVLSGKLERKVQIPLCQCAESKRVEAQPDPVLCNLGALPDSVLPNSHILTRGFRAATRGV